ncbi:hypothetical protein CGJ03_04965 [Vibrio parahaemolyticus]|nr:hypothetical protein CGJ03_04965 [Vibrio parahaemolyticus]
MLTSQVIKMRTTVHLFLMLCIFCRMRLSGIFSIGDVMIHVLVKLVVKQESVSEFSDALKKLVTESNKELGAIRYEAFKADEVTFFIFEEWESIEALNEHESLPHFLHFGEISKKWLDTVELYKNTLPLNYF